tara:strand:- start:6847 stop:8070 length:1224 start_codon:yes stop_codon:yes gene_type:complete
MAAPLNLSTVDQAVKQHYKPLTVKNLVYKNNPFYALVPKYEQFGGLNMPIPLIYGNPQNVSATFSTAQAETSTSSLGQFLMTRVSNYSVASITGETIKATDGKADAFIRYLTMEIDGAIHALARDLSVALFRDGGGYIGQVNSSYSSGTTITLANTDEIANFEVGMTILFASDTGGSTSATSATTISSIDRSAGSFVVASATGIAADDYVFRSGTQAGATLTSTSAKAVMGLDGWLPSSAPGSTAFFGQDRSVDTERLGGIRFDGSAMPIEEALVSGAAKAARAGARPDTCLMSYESYINLEKSLGSRVRYDELKARDADVGFRSLSVQGPNGVISVVPDQNCQPDVAYMLQLDTWSLNSLGGAPHILDLDGNRILRQSTADAYEVRVGFYGNLACNAPGYNVRIAL